MKAGFLRKIAGISLVMLLFVASAEAQNKKATMAEKKKAKIERSYKKAYGKARKKTIKHRREIQTEATRERMDQTDKRAEANRNQNDPGFFERIFKRKRPNKR